MYIYIYVYVNSISVTSEAGTHDCRLQTASSSALFQHGGAWKFGDNMHELKTAGGCLEGKEVFHTNQQILLYKIVYTNNN